MQLYMAMRVADKAPLFYEGGGIPGGALMVFADQDVARAEIAEMGELAFVAEVSHERVVERLQDAGEDRVVFVLEKDERYLTDTTGLERVAGIAAAHG